MNHVNFFQGDIITINIGKDAPCLNKQQAIRTHVFLNSAPCHEDVWEVDI
jgi:hypothetical protein